jgi:hypothetical protein
MEVHFTPEQEAQLTQLATKTGTDAEHLVKDRFDYGETRVYTIGVTSAWTHRDGSGPQRRRLVQVERIGPNLNSGISSQETL